MRTASLLAVVLGATAVAGGPLTGSLGMGRWQQVHDPTAAPKPSIVNCTWLYFEQKLDHFAQEPNPATYQERYCLYDKYWKKGADVGFTGTDEQAPIFFYTGNESPVDEYVNNTGLMWEMGERMGALLVFAEHRYEGDSVPKLHGVKSCISFCTTSQALADFAALIKYLKGEYKTDAPVIAFGGSYGGQLSGWMRIKYPDVLAGAIAGSAPVSGFPSVGGKSVLDSSSAALSNGIQAEGGAPPQCFTNLRSLWPLMKSLENSKTATKRVSSAAKRCKASTVEEVLQWGQGPWFYMAEGDYPFPSTYITYSLLPGEFPLPAWPMRVACSQGLEKDYGITVDGDASKVQYNLTMGKLKVNVDWQASTSNVASLTEAEIEESGIYDLVAAMTEGAAVWYNVSGAKTCFGDAEDEVLPDRLRNEDHHHTNTEQEAVSSNAATCDSCPVCENCPPCPLCERENVDACTYVDVPVVSKLFAWGPICCNEDLYLANTYVQGVGRDLFWPPNVPENYTLDSVIGPHKKGSGCYQGYDDQGLFGTPKYSDHWCEWMTSYYHSVNVSQYSNIVWSNGALDPWSGAGVYGPGGSFSGPMVQNVTEDGSSVALVMDLGAHHLDLFFATDSDPPSAIKVREIEEQKIREWSQQHYDSLNA